jgi:hypothetical protein
MGQRLTHGSGPICVRGAGSPSSGQLVRSGKAPDELDASQSASKCARGIARAASAAVALRSAGAGLARALLVRAFAGHFTSPRWSTIGRPRPRLHMGLAAMSDTRHFLPTDSTIAWLVRLRSRHARDGNVGRTPKLSAKAARNGQSFTWMAEPSGIELETRNALKVPPPVRALTDERG